MHAYLNTSMLNGHVNQIVTCYREEMLTSLRQNRGQIFVAEVGVEVVGFVSVR